MKPATGSYEQPNLTELAAFDTPTICNAIELFGVRPPTAGYMDRRVAACFPELPPMVGYAVTATFRSADAARRRVGAPDLSARQLEIISELHGAAVVVFQDLDDPPAGATFGDGMCLTYQTFGAVGLITSGAARDLDNVRSLNFPCFSNGVVCGHGYCHTESIDVPVQVGGVTIHPGDLLHGDCNGVTTIPLEIAHAVPYACSEFLKHEAVVLDRLRAGNTDIPGHRQAITEMGKRLGELKEELSRRVQK